MFLAVLLLPLIAHAESESAVGADVFPNTGFTITYGDDSNYYRDDCSWEGTAFWCEGQCPAGKHESFKKDSWSSWFSRYSDTFIEFGEPCWRGIKKWCCPKKCQNTFNLVGEGRKCEVRTFKGTGKTYDQCLQICLQDMTCKAVFGSLSHETPDKIRGDGSCWTCTGDEPEGFDANYNVYRRDCRQCLNNFSYMGKKKCSGTRKFVGLKKSYTECTKSCENDWKCRGVFGTLDANQKDTVFSDGSCWKCYSESDSGTTSEFYNMYKRQCPDYAADDARKSVATEEAVSDELMQNAAALSANQASAGEFQSVAMVSAEPFNATDALVLLFAAVGIFTVVGLTYKEGKRRLQSHPYENVDTV